MPTVSKKAPLIYTEAGYLWYDGDEMKQNYYPSVEQMQDVIDTFNSRNEEKIYLVPTKSVTREHILVCKLNATLRSVLTLFRMGKGTKLDENTCVIVFSWKVNTTPTPRTIIRKLSERLEYSFLSS
jgi:hypothetical protein